MFVGVMEKSVSSSPLVRSYGTEYPPTDRPVPPRDEIFQYIIFRGADIEDLQVREPPQTTLPQDPAIVEVKLSARAFFFLSNASVCSHRCTQPQAVQLAAVRHIRVRTPPTRIISHRRRFQQVRTNRRKIRATTTTILYVS